MLTDCYLYGALGKKFGHHWRLDVNSPAQLVRALSALRPDFIRTVLEMKDVDFGVKIGDQQMSEEELQFPSNGRSMSITPVLRGAGKDMAWIEIVAGVVLIAAGIVFFHALGTFAAPIILMGIGLVFGGVAALLSPSPPTLETSLDKHKASYQFNGPINTIEEGQPVPVLYGGPLWIGSAVVSAGIFSQDTNTLSGTTTSGGTDSDTGSGSAGEPIGSRYL